MPIREEPQADRERRRAATKRLGGRLLVVNVLLGGICGYIGGGWIGVPIGAVILGFGVILGMWFYFALVFR